MGGGGLDTDDSCYGVGGVAVSRQRAAAERGTAPRQRDEAWPSFFPLPTVKAKRIHFFPGPAHRNCEIHVFPLCGVGTESN